MGAGNWAHSSSTRASIAEMGEKGSGEDVRDGEDVGDEEAGREEEADDEEERTDGEDENEEEEEDRNRVNSTRSMTQ